MVTPLINEEMLTLTSRVNSATTLSVLVYRRYINACNFTIGKTNRIF